jgi:hypothetical protein
VCPFVRLTLGKAEAHKLVSAGRDVELDLEFVTGLRAEFRVASARRRALTED